MAHAAIPGMTSSGKTMLALELAHDFSQRGFNVLVADPWRLPHWPANFITDDVERLYRVARRSQRCAIFIEEAGNFGREPSFEWFFTQSRQWGHVVHYISQYHTQVPPIVRANVERLFLFKCGLRSAKEWSEEFAQPELVAMVGALERHHFIATSKYAAPRVLKLRLTATLRDRPRPLATVRDLCGTSPGSRCDALER